MTHALRLDHPSTSVPLWRAALLGAGIALLVGPPLRAQAPPEPEPRETYSEVLDVQLVEIQVEVEDSRGEPVIGLEENQFRLLVDGGEVPFEVFEEISGVRPVERDDVTGRGATAPPPEALSPGRAVLIFMDDVFTSRSRRRQLLGRLAKDLEALEPGDRVAVVRYGGTGIEVLQDWTGDREALEEVIRDLRELSPDELRQSAEITGSNQDVFEVMDPIVTLRRQVTQIRQVAEAMAVAMQTLADTPGRKLLLPVTNGWRFDSLRSVPDRAGSVSATGTRDTGLVNPAPPLGAAQTGGGGSPAGAGITTGQSDVARPQGLQLLDPMIDTAQLLGYAVMPLLLQDGDELTRTSLWLLARQTGGRIATEGAAARLPLNAALAGTDSYYTLGFHPSWKADDRIHTVEVKVDAPRVATVRHRLGFKDLSTAARREMAARRALYLEGEGGDLEMSVGPLPNRRRGTVEVPVEIKIPMDWVTTVPVEGDPDGQVAARLVLRVEVVDEQGDRAEVPPIPIDITGPPPPPGVHALWSTELQLRGVDQRLVLYLVDQLSGESKVGAVNLEM